MVTLAEARANKTKIDWASYHAAHAEVHRRRVFKNYDLAELADYIDWGPFFQTWELAGTYPGILNDDNRGRVGATRVLPTRKSMLATA